MESASTRRRAVLNAKRARRAQPHRADGGAPAWSEQFLAREKAILEMIARGRPVDAVLEALTRSVEAEVDGLLCSVLLVDRDGRRLRHGAGPSLPAAWREAVDGIAIGPGESPCSRAAFSAERVIVEDLSTDPLWIERRALAERLGLRACWSVPILSGEKKVLGTFAQYYRQPRAPSERDLALIDRVLNIAGIVLERSRAEDALRDSEERFRSLSKLSSDWYWEQDENFRFTKMSDALLGRSGRVAAAAHIGKRRWELPTLNMTHADWEAHRALLEAHQPFSDFEICRPDQEGNPCYASISGEPIFDDAGKFRGYRGVGKDITARKREEELLRLEHSVARSLAEAESASTGLRAVIRALCETEVWDCGRYWRVDEADGVLRFGDAWGPPIPRIQELIEASRGFVFRPGEGFAGKVLQTGEPLWVADVGSDPRAMYRASFAKGGIRAAFVFPVTAEARTIGVIGISCARVRAPDDRLLQAVRVIGSQVGQFLKRKDIEQALRES
ncbi:MAG TPA: GAF domain-containing protein [Burkholderiales bacterium]